MLLALLFSWGCLGCGATAHLPAIDLSSLAPIGSPSSEAPTDPDAIAAAPRPGSRNWVILSRHGRNALKSGRYREAEEQYVRALQALGSTSLHDTRREAVLGNLVRLASIHARLERREAAHRVMGIVYDQQRAAGGGAVELARYGRLYAGMVERPLSPHFRPVIAEEIPSRRGLDGLIESAALTHHVDPALVKAVVAAESNFDTRAVSHAGALGLMQLMPQTARELGVRAPFDPKQNIDGGVRYLRQMFDRFGKLAHALAAYNAGPEAVDRYGGIPPYDETQSYVERVLGFYRDYQNHFTR